MTRLFLFATLGVFNVAVCADVSVGEGEAKLIEHKESLTVAGKLDEAVRAAIEQLQNSHLPVSRAERGELAASARTEVRGICDGLDETVRLSKCEL